MEKCIFYAFVISIRAVSFSSHEYVQRRTVEEVKVNMPFIFFLALDLMIAEFKTKEGKNRRCLSYKKCIRLSRKHLTFALNVNLKRNQKEFFLQLCAEMVVNVAREIKQNFMTF